MSTVQHADRQIWAAYAIARLLPVATRAATDDDRSAIVELAAVVAQFIRHQDDLTVLLASLLGRRPRPAANWVALLTFVTYAGDYIAESADYCFGEHNCGPTTLDGLWGFLDQGLRRVVLRQPIEPHVATMSGDLASEAQDFIDFALGAIDSERGDFNRNLDA